MARLRARNGSADAAPLGTPSQLDRLRALYRRERRLRHAARGAKRATDQALVELVAAGEPYELLVRAVVPPAESGDEIAIVRAERKRLAASFRKRVERDRRHASSQAEGESALSCRPSERTVVGKETTKMPADSYLRRRTIEEFAPVEQAMPPAGELGDEDLDDEDLDECDDDLRDARPHGDVGGDAGHLAGDEPEVE